MVKSLDRDRSPSLFVISHFDGHGVATGVTLARALGGKVLARFPDTGPQRLANFIRELDVAGKYVHIVDIPVNIADPDDHIAALEEAAARAEKVVVWDHHSTDLRYVSRFRRVELRFFDSAASMAAAVASMLDEPEYVMLAFIGAVADRDRRILEYFDRDTVENELLPLANILDIMVRKDAQATADKLLERGVKWLAEQEAAIVYPPSRLVNALRIAKSGARTVLVEPITLDYARQIGLETWIPKTLEQLLINTEKDYAVVATENEDRKTGERFWSVRVLKYWLSNAESPMKIIKNMAAASGKQIVGHEDYISIRASDAREAARLAETVFYELEMPASRVAGIISEAVVARAIEDDFRKIMKKIDKLYDMVRRCVGDTTRQMG